MRFAIKLLISVCVISLCAGSVVWLAAAFVHQWLLK